MEDKDQTLGEGKDADAWTFWVDWLEENEVAAAVNWKGSCNKVSGVDMEDALPPRSKGRGGSA